MALDSFDSARDGGLEAPFPTMILQLDIEPDRGADLLAGADDGTRAAHLGATPCVPSHGAAGAVIAAADTGNKRPF